MQADFERLAGRGTRRVGLSLASRHLNGDLFHHREDGSWKSLAGRPVVAHSCHFLRRLPFDAADRTVATPTLYFISALTIFTNSNWCARRKRDLMAIRRWSIVWTWIERGLNRVETDLCTDGSWSAYGRCFRFKVLLIKIIVLFIYEIFIKNEETW